MSISVAEIEQCIQFLSSSSSFIAVTSISLSQRIWFLKRNSTWRLVTVSLMVRVSGAMKKAGFGPNAFWYRKSWSGVFLRSYSRTSRVVNSGLDERIDASTYLEGGEKRTILYIVQAARKFIIFVIQRIDRNSACLDFFWFCEIDCDGASHFFWPSRQDQVPLLDHPYQLILRHFSVCKGILHTIVGMVCNYRKWHVDRYAIKSGRGVHGNYFVGGLLNTKDRGATDNGCPPVELLVPGHQSHLTSTNITNEVSGICKRRCLSSRESLIDSCRYFDSAKPPTRKTF